MFVHGCSFRYRPSRASTGGRNTAPATARAPSAHTSTAAGGAVLRPLGELGVAGRHEVHDGLDGRVHAFGGQHERDADGDGRPRERIDRRARRRGPRQGPPRHVSSYCAGCARVDARRPTRRRTRSPSEKRDRDALSASLRTNPSSPQPGSSVAVRAAGGRPSSSMAFVALTSRPPASQRFDQASRISASRFSMTSASSSSTWS